mmetsp:Transcript_27221/g.76917  ORF Transcript_27221/g.76917 Transcript_27221/m.76917 type:complete len:83 (-) Transcript_27221:189-437(-)
MAVPLQDESDHDSGPLNRLLPVCAGLEVARGGGACELDACARELNGLFSLSGRTLLFWIGSAGLKESFDILRASCSEQALLL